MVDFGNTIFEGDLPPSVPIVQPVDNKSGQIFAGALSSGIQNMNQTLFDPSAKAAQNKKIEGGALQELSDYVSTIADARDQGMSTDEAMRHIRVKVNDLTAQYPEFTDDIHTLTNKILSDNGLGRNITKETPQETGNRKLIEEGQSLGWDMTTQAGINSYKTHKQDLINLDLIDTKVKQIEASGQVVNAQIKSQATTALHSTLASGLGWVNDQINNAYKQLASVTDPAQRQAIIDDTKNTVEQKIALIDQFRSLSGNAVDTSYMTASYEKLLTMFEDRATGKTTADAYKQQSDNIEARINSTMLTDNPEIASLIVMSKSSNYASPVLITQLAQKQMEWYASLGYGVSTDNNGQIVSDGKAPDLVESYDKVKPVFDTIKSEVKNISGDPTVDASTIKDESNKIVNVLRSVATYGANEQDPKNLLAVVDFLADPNVGKFIETNKDQIIPKVMANAKYVVEQQYDGVVLPLINEKWTAAQAYISPGHPNWTTQDIYSSGIVFSQNPENDITNVDINKAIVPTWNGSGIEFRVADQYKDNVQVNTIAKDLNQGKESIAKPLNDLIRLSAHLQGTTDYKKIYDEQYAPRLWATGQQDVPGDISSFNTDNQTGVSGNYFQKLSQAESGGNQFAKNPNSSALGPSQFTVGTWSTLMRTHPELKLTADGRTNPEQDQRALVAFTNDNTAGLKAAGIPVTDANAYAAHFLGLNDAIDVLSAPDNAALSDYLTPKVLRANSFLEGMTVGDFKKWTASKFTG